MIMTGMEFYFTPKGEVMIIDECGTRQLEQSNREFISEIITRMGIFWPEALEKASLEYTDRRYNIPWFEFSIVRRFLKCNFGEFDSTMDIDQLGNFQFEEVNTLDIEKTKSYYNQIRSGDLCDCCRNYIT